MLHLVLYNPEIAHNTGAIGRTCVALDAKLWLVRPLGFQMSDKKIRRAGMDYWEHLNWQAVNDWSDLLSQLGEEVPLYFLTKFAQKSYTEADFSQDKDVALVFGSESRGLPASFQMQYTEKLLRIPISEEARSLNLSVAAAVAAFEVQRQWGR